MKQVMFSNAVASAVIMAIRDVCGYRPVLVLYGLGPGDAVPAGPEIPHGPGYGYVIGEAQCPDSDWSGVGGPWLRENDAGLWKVTSVEAGEVAYARVVHADTGECLIQSAVAEGDPGPDGPAVWMDETTIDAAGVEVTVSMVRLEVPQSAHLMP